MRLPTYLYRRPDTGSFLFRWVVPVFLRPLLGGRREIRRTLPTHDKRLALKAARELSVLLQRSAQELARRKKTGDEVIVGTTRLSPILTFAEKYPDGRVRSVTADIDSEKLETENKALEMALKLFGLEKGSEIFGEGQEASMTLGGLVSAYFNERTRTKPLTAKTRQEVESTFTLMLEVLGAETAVAVLTRKDFARLKEVLQKLPKNKTKDARYRDKTALQLANMAIPAADLLTARTLNKNWDRVATLFKWATLNGHVKENFAEGMRFAESASKRSNPKREPYTDGQIAKLFEFLLSADYDAERKPWRKYVPLLGFYTGARLNELCQLHTDDFIEEDGIPCIRITDEGDVSKRLKNENSRRVVPVHPELIRIGLLKYVDGLRAKGVHRLFPQLSAGRDGYGKNVSRWYGELMETLGIDRDFHAIRHNVVNRLREAGVEEDRIADIVGHSRSSKITLSTYARALSVKAKQFAIGKLHYGAEVVPLVRDAAA